MNESLKKVCKKIKLTKKITISNNHKCFIVAEISANHGGNLNILKKTILAAKKAGVNAVKIQSYQAETITLKSKNKHFLINDNSILLRKELDKIISIHEK